MTWRSLLIQNGGKLSLQRRQLLIQQNGDSHTVPLEDIAVIIIENRETLITAPLLSALAEHGSTLLTCDEQFLPCGQWLRPLQNSFSSDSRDPNTGFRLFLFQISTDSTQTPP